MFLELFKRHDSRTILAFKSELLQQIVEELMHECALLHIVANGAPVYSFILQLRISLVLTPRVVQQAILTGMSLAVRTLHDGL